MFTNVKVNDEFKLKVNGANYEVYAITGVGKKYVPNSGEVIVHLKLTSRSFFSLGSNLLLSCPEANLHEFFDARK